MSNNMPHTSKGVYQIMRDDEYWTKDALVDYIEDLERITGEWWEETKKEYVKVVRCKECKFYEKGHGCDLLNVFMLNMDDWFCAYGERKENEN